MIDVLHELCLAKGLAGRAAGALAGGRHVEAGTVLIGLESALERLTERVGRECQQDTAECADAPDGAPEAPQSSLQQGSSQ